MGDSVVSSFPKLIRIFLYNFSRWLDLLCEDSLPELELNEVNLRVSPYKV